MRTDVREDAITDYERAVCYYTLPRVISPVTMGLIGAYALCVIESLCVLAYGLHSGSLTWIYAGFYAFAGIIIFGMVAFTMRALMNEWRFRVALAIARNVPEPARNRDIPNPFERHVLLSRPVAPDKEGFECLDGAGDISYCVEINRYNAHWHVRNAVDKTAFDVRSLHGSRQLDVYVNNEPVASVQRSMTLRAAIAKIVPADALQRSYSITNGCVYDGKRLVGRIYRLRRRIFLDVEQVHINDGLLAHFVSL